MHIPHSYHRLARREEGKSKEVTLDVLIVILVLATIIVFPLAIWLYDRRRRYHGKSKASQQRLRAQRKLDTAAQRRRVLDLALDAKTGTEEEKRNHSYAQTLDETDSLCPICLCFLPSPEQLQVLTPVVRPSVPFKARMPFVLSAADARIWDRKTAEEEEGDLAEQDVLTLNTCKHSFHAACLTSWFLLEKYNCPVCKGKYFDPKGRFHLDARRQVGR